MCTPLGVISAEPVGAQLCSIPIYLDKTGQPVL